MMPNFIDVIRLRNLAELNNVSVALHQQEVPKVLHHGRQTHCLVLGAAHTETEQ